MAYDPMQERVTLREFVFKRLEVYISKEMSMLEFELARDRIALAEHLDVVFRKMVYDLRLYVTGDKTVTNVEFVLYPKTWWEAFKGRWFNDWMKARWPVQYIERRIPTTTIMRMCPHLPLNPKESHIRWLMYEAPRHGDRIVVRDGTVPG